MVIASEKPFTKAEFKGLSPYSRGYAVYIMGCSDDEPNIPNEKNPYPMGSVKAKQWDGGEQAAMFAAQECEE